MQVAIDETQTQLEPLWIRKRRADMLAAMDVGYLRQLRRLASLDRYERVALTME